MGQEREFDHFTQRAVREGEKYRREHKDSRPKDPNREALRKANSELYWKTLTLRNGTVRVLD